MSSLDFQGLDLGQLTVSQSTNFPILLQPMHFLLSKTNVMGTEILPRKIQASETVMTDEKIVNQYLEGCGDSKTNPSSVPPTRVNLVKLLCASVSSPIQQG